MPNMNVSEFPGTDLYRSALKANEEHLKSLIASNGDDHPDVNTRKVETAEVYKGLGMMQEAVDMLSEVIESYQRSVNDPVLLSSAMNDLALVYSTLHLYENAEDLFHKIVKILSQTVEADQAVVWGNIAITLRNSNNFSKAIPMHELAVKVMDTILGCRSPEALFQRAQLGVTLKQSGDNGERSRGETLLAESISELQALGYKNSHIWIKDLLQ
jgi:tetratricopeptide (TPR) repeat protein